MIERDYFLSPRTWRTHKDTIRSLVLPIRSPGHDPRQTRMEADLDRLARTNDWLSMYVPRPVDRPATERGKETQTADPAPTPTSVAKVLDDIARPSSSSSSSSSIDGIRGVGRTLFGNDPFGKERRAGTRARIKDVLDWATQRAVIDARTVIVGVAVIKNVVLDDFPAEIDLQVDQAKEKSRRYHLVSAVVLEWIREMAKDVTQRSPVEVDPVVQVLGRLIRLGLFDYQEYLGHMISIGGRRDDTLDHSFERQILAELPWQGIDESIGFQRRMLLYGSDPELNEQEDKEVQAVGRETRAYLADWLGSEDDRPADDTVHLRSTSNSTKWRVWADVRPGIVTRIRSLGHDGELGGTRLPRLLMVCMSMLDYELIFELIARVVEVQASNDRVQLVCIQTLQRNAVVWDALGLSEQTGSSIETLQGHLSSIIARRYTPSPAEQDLTRFVDANVPAGCMDPITSTTQLFREVVEIHRQPSLEAVDRLAEGLVREFPRDGQVGEQVWNLALSGLADLDITLLQPEGENKAVEATVRLLQSLGEYYPGVMDLSFRKWARSVLRKPTVATVNGQSCSLLLELVSKRVITIRSLLEGLLLPLWRSMAAFVSSASQAVPEQSRFVSLLSRAIFRPKASDASISLFTRSGLAAELELAFDEVSVGSAVVKHLPFLAIIAVNTKSDRDMALFLRELCHVEPLKVFAVRQQAVVRDAVSKSPFSWEGHHEARELVETCIRDLLSTSTMAGECGLCRSVRAWSDVSCIFSLRLDGIRFVSSRLVGIDDRNGRRSQDPDTGRATSRARG